MIGYKAKQKTSMKADGKQKVAACLVYSSTLKM
jgi:hypothetical protein